MLRFKGLRGHKGFDLDGELRIDQKIGVLTGKNGSGKTRFLEAIANGNVIVDEDGEEIAVASIKMIEHKSLVPQFYNGYDENSRKMKVLALKQILEACKGELDEPLSAVAVNHPLMAQRAGRLGGADWPQAHRVIGLIARKLGKKPSEVSGGEVDSYYDEYRRLTFGEYDVGAIFKDYLRRKESNLYFQWLRQERGREDVHFVSEDSFESEFGGPPWVALNSILSDLFDGKFKFSEPGHEYDPAFVTSLCLSADGTPLEPKELSSGEQTLLWLVLTIFNTRAFISSTQTPKLLLIDEPDAFLHPSMVLKMVQCFESFCDVFDAVVLFTTHSPTTVALAPVDAIYVVDDNKVSAVDQDGAICELLDGVTQISISPHNRRQVYVESSSDVEIFQMLYDAVLRKSEFLDKKISLTFVSAGMKYPRGLVAEKLREFFGGLESGQVELYTSAINGVGGCVQVKGAVEHLCDAGSITVRGLIDRDANNIAEGHVHVLGGGVCYAIENLVFDPVCTLLKAHLIDDQKFSMTAICGAEVTYDQWLEDDDLLQKSVDVFIDTLLGRPNLRDVSFEYMGGKRLLSDSGYLNHHGHELWKDKISIKYAPLKRCGKNEEGVKKEIVRCMLLHTKGKFVPSLFVAAFSDLQK
ncbi:AAA family ATPase [Pseudomonas thivervalensis]|uniref:AAA family ATPase n=1 Tax=Pseudomonas thivervalensis TaxID=86265 RepID=UPI00069CD73C|nr:AAA family ATPase [Pseudomonas thivervalensis]OAB54139.1 hypothetical protein APS14_19020 [Pseudomonas thivervalensis]SDG41190.1 AAA domain-containing protein, putative AbiEii toxin, Type IV TA system [Pseudomonas thivervalensis]